MDKPVSFRHNCYFNNYNDLYCTIIFYHHAPFYRISYTVYLLTEQNIPLLGTNFVRLDFIFGYFFMNFYWCKSIKINNFFSYTKITKFIIFGDESLSNCSTIFTLLRGLFYLYCLAEFEKLRLFSRK